MAWSHTGTLAVYDYGDDNAAKVLTTATAAGTYVPVAVADVQAGVAVGVNPAVGTFVVPAEADVENGVNYGAAAEFTGEYAPAGTASILGGGQFDGGFA